ncbi:CU044_5270 family protein [Streptomyces sp. NPDC056257]|uniref:CU044_5270 family protein n=1 Tax=Streptomyces sp. NPDC056257 TaxID=3345765 RepID=UPI0035D95FA5
MTDRPKDPRDPMAFPLAERLRAAGEVAAPGPAVLEAALSAVRAAAAAEPETAPEVVPLRPRRVVPRSRKLLVSALAIAAIAAGVSVYPVAGLKGSPPAATASAADFLRQVAAAEAKGTATDAPYWKVHTVDSFWGHPLDREHRYSEKPTVRDESTWVSAGALFVQDGADGEVRDSGRRSTSDWIRYVPSDLTAGFGWDEMKRLPTDAAALKAVLRCMYPKGPGSGSGPGPYLDYMRYLTLLLKFAPLEPKQRAALYEVLADMPGLRLVGPVKDSTGRPGTAVEADFPEMRIRLIVDPQEGDLLEDTTYYRGGEHDGKLAVRTTIVSAGPQQSIPPYWDATEKDESPGVPGTSSC